MKETIEIEIKSENYENDKTKLVLRFETLPENGFSLYLQISSYVTDDGGYFEVVLHNLYHSVDFYKIVSLYLSNNKNYLKDIKLSSLWENDYTFFGGKDKFDNYFLKINSWRTDSYWFLIKQPIINFLQNPNDFTFNDLKSFENDFYNLKITKQAEEVNTKKRFDFAQLEFSFLPIIIDIAAELPYNDFYDELIFSEQIKFFYAIFCERLFQKHQIKIEELDTYSIDWVKSKINEFHKYSTRNSTD